MNSNQVNLNELSVKETPAVAYSELVPEQMKMIQDIMRENRKHNGTAFIANQKIEDCELKLKPNHVVICGRQVHIKNIPFEEYILKSKPINKLPRGKHFKNRVGKPMPLVIFDELNYKLLSF